MKLGEILQSIEAWRKLAAINMRPKLAYAVLKYSQVVSGEYAIVEKQRAMLLRAVTGTKDGEDAKVEPGTPEFAEFVAGLNEIVSQESSLKKIDLELETVVDALGDKDNALSVADLAALEPFFTSKDDPY